MSSARAGETREVEKKPTKLLREGMRNRCRMELLSSGVGLVCRQKMGGVVKGVWSCRVYY